MTREVTELNESDLRKTNDAYNLWSGSQSIRRETGREIAIFAVWRQW